MATSKSGSVDKSRLWGHLRHLCEEIGPRLSGTPSDEQAVEYMAAHLKRVGARVEIQDYPCPGWEHESTELSLMGAGAPEGLHAVAQTFTNGCDLEAEIAVVGTWHDVEYRPDLEGKLLVLHGEAGSGLALDRNAGLLAIEERRPAGVIVAGTSENVASKLIRDPFLRIPAAAVSASVGKRLLESAGARARLRIRARRYDSTSHNVIGSFPGTGKGRVVVGGHYDTAALTQGATDDGCGTAATLELAEVFGALARGKLGLDFVAFGAEEYGRHLRALGSVEYVRRRGEATRETRAMVQMDGIGNVDLATRVFLMGWEGERREALRDLLAAQKRCVVVEDSVGGSDHMPFFLNGVPVVVFMNEYRHVPIHTPADSMDLMDPEEFAHAVEVVRAVVAHLAGVEA